MAEEQQDQTGAATDEAPPTEPTLVDLLRAQQEYRDELTALRQELARSRQAAPSAPATQLSAEELLAARLAEIDKFPYYCPGCGALYKYQRECIGLHGSQPHPPIEVVSTDELKSGDESQHSPAPVSTQGG